LKRTILLTRSAEDNEVWARGLREQGIDAISFPCLSNEVLREHAEELKARLSDCTWIALSSRHAVRAVQELAPSIWPGGPRIACVGPVTAALAESLLGPVDLIAPLGTADSLATALLERIERDARVLLVAAEQGRPELEERFRAAGRDFERLVLYRTRSISRGAVEECPATDAIFFASPSAVHAFAEENTPTPGARVISLGPTTSAALREVGWRVDGESRTRDLSGMIEATNDVW
jgi:uroporphyrinogen-III synthase